MQHQLKKVNGRFFPVNRGDVTVNISAMVLPIFLVLNSLNLFTGIISLFTGKFTSSQPIGLSITTCRLPSGYQTHLMSWITNIKRSDWLLIVIYYSLAFVITFFAEWVEEDIPLFTTQSLPLLKHLLVQFALQVISVLVIVFGVFANYFPSRRYFPLFALILVVLLAQVFLQHLLLSNMGPLGPDYVANILWGIIDNFSDVTPIALFLMAKQYYASQNRLLALERNQKDAELRQLESQVDPHFLFNSLNILDILIETDPAKARVFTQKLSSLYRYLIRHRNEEMVPLPQEWAFCQDYIYLLEQRFAQLFFFEHELNTEVLSQYFIPPAVMQTLLENVVKHNAAFPDAPVTVSIKLKEDNLVISNTLRPKSDTKDSLGTGLSNLSRRLELLTGRAAHIETSATHFTVTIPLAKQAYA